MTIPVLLGSSKFLWTLSLWGCLGIMLHDPSNFGTYLVLKLISYIMKIMIEGLKIYLHNLCDLSRVSVNLSKVCQVTLRYI